MKLLNIIKKYFKSSEEVISMFLGLIIVVMVVGMIFNFIQKRKGSVTIPGVSDINITKEDFINQEKVGSDENVYEVMKNDSLWRIAQDKYNNGLIWSEIAKINKLDNPDKLEIGQKLVLPKIDKVEVATTTENKGTTISIGDYKVVKNDNLWKIAIRAYGDGYQWTRIWQENKTKLIDPDKLEIGMNLNIPSLK